MPGSQAARLLATALVGLMAAPSCGGGGSSRPAAAENVLVAGPVVSLSPAAPAEKARLAVTTYVRPDGTYETVMVAAFQLGIGHEVWEWSGRRTQARDIYVVRSVDGGATWSAAWNVSAMADLTSMDVDHDGEPGTPAVPYAGDCGTPVLAAQGAAVLLAWESRYVPSGRQGVSAFAEAGGAEVPFAAVYVARSLDGGATWSAPDRLSDGSRDANALVMASASSGVALAWQEDARGLQPGEGEGPGDGGSGARVSPGTDLWYSALTSGQIAEGKAFPEPVAVTDNAPFVPGAPMGEGGEEYARSEGEHDGSSREDSESGHAPLIEPAPGASRPVLFLVGKHALLAYEETKGNDGEGGDGKYVRYHVFTDFVAPRTADATLGAGTILSDPACNARRPRLIVQQTAGAGTGLRLLAIWREGVGGCEFPADVVGRIGRIDAADAASTGLRPADMLPAVDPGAERPSAAAANEPALNLSSSLGLTVGSDDDPLENARAHRGVVRGDKILLAYLWAADQTAADVLAVDSYDLLVRTSEDGGTTWSAPENLSRLSDPTVTVVEPRIAATPGSPDPAVVQDREVAFLAWATQENLPASASGPEPRPLDVFVARTPDFGRSWERAAGLAATPGAEQEAQLRVSPDGRSIYAVWVAQDSEMSDPRVCGGGLHVETVSRGTRGHGSGASAEVSPRGAP